MTKENLGRFIAENRKKLGMTQEELAEKLFVTNKAVSKWENGQSFPDIALFEPLAEALEVSVSELFAGEKEEKDASVKEIIALSKTVIKKEERKLQIALTVLIFVIIGFVIAYSPVIKENSAARNMEYIYWQGFYYTPENHPVPGNRITPIGVVREAGRKNENNYGGDSNIADPGTEIYRIDDEDLIYKGCIAARVDGHLTCFRFTFFGRQEYEKYNQKNVKEGEWGKGYFRSEDFY